MIIGSVKVEIVSFFAIWKLVSKEKLEFTPALTEVSKMHLADTHMTSPCCGT
jgi:hypothetical protein